MNRMINTGTLRSDPQENTVPATADVLSYAVTNCELGKVLVARSPKGVCSILLGDDAEVFCAFYDITPGAEVLVEDLAGRFPQAILVPNEPAVKDDVAGVLGYLAKPSGGLQLTLDMRGTPFQRRVWEKLRAIPAGRTVSYTELAGWLSPLSHPRDVATACAANPVALAIPCHRVVRGNGALAGYRWGIERKRILIEKEARA